MAELNNFFVYNPSSLSDDDFLRTFVARHHAAAQLIDRLATTKDNEVARHQLILGPRGMGKTTMLRRIALSASIGGPLHEIFVPLSFREEQYNVHSLDIFWANCLDALGDLFDRRGQAEKASQLDSEIDALQETPGAKLSLFRRWIEAEGKRPLLLLDNIDLIFSGLKKEQRILKEHMEEAGWIVVVGGAATTIDSLTEVGGAFHSLFDITVLDRLAKDELIACLRSLAIARGSAGENVLRLVDQQSARIKTLHDLTGGNPRTLTLLYMLLELDTGGDVFSDLERLLDQVTVLYKARVEDLPAQARVILDAVALAWNPVLAAEVAAVTLLDVTSVSSQLDRLQKEGVIEKVRVSKTTKSAYQVCERFFNVWYIMRHGPRRQRARLRWLTVFLRSFYTTDQLVERAKTIVNSNEDVRTDGGEFVIALSEAIDDAGWRAALKNHARDELEKYAQELGRELSDIVDPSDVPRPVTASEWVRHGNLLRQHLKRAKETENAFLTATSLEPESFSAWFNLGSVRLNLGNPSGAVDALRTAVHVGPTDLTAHFLLGHALVAIGALEEAKAIYLQCLGLNQRFFLGAIALGDLHTQTGQYLEAEKFYNKAAAIAPKSDIDILHAGAFFSAYIVEQFDRSYRLYERLLDLRKDDFVGQTNAALLGFFISTPEHVVELDESLLAKHPPHGAALMKALVALKSGNKSQALSNLPQIFQASNEQIFEDYRGFFLLLLREASRANWGEFLLSWMAESGASDRHWPLYAAFEAYLHGPERLLDVNPEVRVSAAKILALLEAPAKYRAGLAQTQKKSVIDR